MTKSKLMKRLVALATTAIMVGTMAIPAMAATEGKITVHKYAGTQASNQTNTTGEVQSVPPGYTALPGAEFTLYALDVATVNAAISDTNKVQGHRVNPASGTPTSVEFIMSSGTNVTVPVGAVAQTGTTNATGIIEWTSLNLGWYVLAETDAPAGYDATATSVIQLPLTKTNGEPNYDVHVYPKNVSNANLAVKDIGGEQKPVSNGESVTFDLKAKFQNSATVAGHKVNSVADLRAGASAPYTYGVAKITDELNTYFNIPTTVTAYWLDGSGELDITAGAIPSSQVNITAAQTTVATLTNDGIDAAIAGNKLGFGLRIVTVYNGGALGASAPISNKMTSTMQNPTGGDDNDTSTEDSTYVPSISIEIEKTNLDGTTKLSGAKFELATVANPTTDADYVRVGGNRLTVETDTDGKASFSNLNGYLDATGAEFWLVETQAPAGYKIKTVPVHVTFDSKAGYIAKIGTTTPATWFESGAWTENAQIVNNVSITNAALDQQDPDEPGFSLPLTGGAGTMMFTIGGIAIMLGAALVLIKGKSAKKES